jgi:membrane protein DedA with SNARE-associated domain
MSFWRFLLAIFAGRFFRFLILGFLTLRFGPQVVEIGGRIVVNDLKWVLLALAAGGLLWLIWRRQAGKKAAAKRNEAGTGT